MTPIDLQFKWSKVRQLDVNECAERLPSFTKQVLPCTMFRETAGIGSRLARELTQIYFVRFESQFLTSLANVFEGAMDPKSL